MINELATAGTSRWSRALGVLAIGSLTLLVYAGCEREAGSGSAVDAGDPAAPAAEPRIGAADVPATTETSTARPWTVPEGWTEDPAPRPMRVATYLAPDADGPFEIAVTRFPGRVGGELANVNRWRGQMGLGPVSDIELESTIARFTASGYDGYEVRLESATGVMLAAGVHDEAANQTWFVRTTAPGAAAADRMEADVFGLARSIAGIED